MSWEDAKMGTNICRNRQTTKNYEKINYRFIFPQLFSLASYYSIDYFVTTALDLAHAYRRLKCLKVLTHHLDDKNVVNHSLVFSPIYRNTI